MSVNVKLGAAVIAGVVIALLIMRFHVPKVSDALKKVAGVV